MGLFGFGKSSKMKTALKEFEGAIGEGVPYIAFLEAAQKATNVAFNDVKTIMKGDINRTDTVDVKELEVLSIHLELIISMLNAFRNQDKLHKVGSLAAIKADYVKITGMSGCLLSAQKGILSIVDRIKSKNISEEDNKKITGTLRLVAVEYDHLTERCTRSITAINELAKKDPNKLVGIYRAAA